MDDQQTIIYYELDWTATTDKPSTTLATTVWQNSESSDEIVRADIIMNAEMYMFQDSTWSPILDDSVSVIFDCESIMLHEFGHLLGLQHVAEEEITIQLCMPKRILAKMFMIEILVWMISLILGKFTLTTSLAPAT